MKIHRRLLIRPGAIGDFIISLPAMEALRADWTEVWCARQNVALARFADGARAIADTGLERLGFLPSPHTVEALRSFDSIISWYGANNEQFQEIAINDLKLNITFLKALPEASDHAGAFYRRQARELGAKDVGNSPRILCPALQRTFAAIHPFASGVRKQAPLAIFRNAEERLSRVMPVRWIRGPQDELEGAVCIPDLYDLGCWLAGSRVYVGNDSGIAHLAAAVGTPVMALFPVTNPRNWMPRGPAVTAIRPAR